MKLTAGAPAKRTPDHLYIELTDRCNLSCKHCYLSAGPAGVRMIDQAVIKKTLSSYVEIGGRSVAFSGGEPLMHPDLLQLAAFASSRGLKITLVTNGILLREKDIRSLLNIGVTLAISIEGLNYETHDAIRGKGSFEKVMSVLDRIRSMGSQDNVIICFTPTRRNVRELFPLASSLMKNGFRRLYLSLLEDRGRELGHKPELSLDREDLVQLFIQLALLLNAPDVKINIDSGHLKYFFDRLLHGGAGADPMESTLRVAPNGRVYLTAYIDDERFCLGNVNVDSMQECWESRRTHELFIDEERRYADGIPACRGCYYSALCGGGSPVRAYAAHKTFLMPDDLCEAKKTFIDRWYSALT